MRGKNKDEIPCYVTRDAGDGVIYLWIGSKPDLVDGEFVAPANEKWCRTVPSGGSFVRLVHVDVLDVVNGIISRELSESGDPVSLPCRLVIG